MSKLEAFQASWAPRMLSILRIMVGLLFFEHGAQKIVGFPPRMPMPNPVAPMPDMPPLPEFMHLLLSASGYFEFVGGALIIVGLFTRCTGFVLSGMMAVGYFAVHAPQSLFPISNMGEPAVLYCFVFLYFFFAGGGSWSVDALRVGKTSPS